MSELMEYLREQARSAEDIDDEIEYLLDQISRSAHGEGFRVMHLLDRLRALQDLKRSMTGEDKWWPQPGKMCCL
jgi:hypothetical protein